MKRYFTFSTAVLFMMLSFALSAQQQFTISLDRANLSVLNPANIDYDFFRKKYLYKVAANYRNAWLGINGAPRTFLAAGERIVDRDNVSLLYGGQMYADKAGRFVTNNASFRYGTVFTNNLFDRGFAIATSINLTQYRLKTENLSADDFEEISSYVDDFSVFRPTVGMGLFYYQKIGSRYGPKNFFYAGLSAPLLYSITKKGNGVSVLDNTVHLFFNGGFIKGLQDDLSFIEFSSFSKYETTGVIFDTDFRIRYNHRGVFNSIVGFSTQGYLIVGAGVNFTTNFESTSYEINYTSNMSTTEEVFRYFGVFHEVTLAASFGQ